MAARKRCVKWVYIETEGSVGREAGFEVGPEEEVSHVMIFIHIHRGTFSPTSNQ